jgi:rod shape determining protein RodA
MDYLLILLPLVLSAVGIVMIDSITQNYASYPRQVIIQMAAVAIGFFLMICAVAFDSRHFSQFYLFFYILSILVQLTVFVPGLGVEIGGQQAWINILGITTMQPSEVVKITFAIAFAAWLDRYREMLFTIKGFLLAFAFALPIVGLVGYIDMGAGLILAFMFIGMVFAAGIRAGLFARLSGLFILLVPLSYRFLQDHQKSRFEAWLHPDRTDIPQTYQVMQSKIAIGSGGLFGKGLGNGTIKESGYLPVQESDFIFAIICEELGFVGGMVVIALYAFMLTRIWRVVRNVKEYFDGLLVVGLMCMFAFQAFENIGMTMGVMPVTGITLPFVSAGGSSVVANMIAVGLIIGVGARSRVRTYKHINAESGPPHG